jgi:NAD(P)-dependent dehydrogenase (short-subunit alcohol dehydrogenase family)
MHGKVCLVTGATSGIGAAVAHEFSEQGAVVVAAGRRVDCGEALVGSLRKHGREALFVRTDVTKEEDIVGVVARTIETFGTVDFAVNCAGVAGDNLRPTAEHSVENWERVIRTNLTGTWLSMKHELKAMVAAGGGSIVNLASIFGMCGSEFGIAPYVASKHAVIGLTRAAAVEYASRHVRVNALCPGITRSEMTTPALEAIPEEFFANIRANVPMGRIAEPEEMARAAVWLCGEGSSFVTGQTLVADGGWLAK